SRRRTDCRRDRADGGKKFETDGAHGRVFRGRSAAAVSGVSYSARGMELGRLSAADERRAAGVGESVRIAAAKSRSFASLRMTTSWEQMTFLEQIFASLGRGGDAVVLQEMRDGQAVPLTARQLLSQVLVARAYLRRLRLKKADRCALLAPNSMQWVAMDLAIMAEGLTVVPLYARQAPAELVAMMKDCWPSVIACGEQSLAEAIEQAWPEAPRRCCFEDVFTAGRGPVENPALAVTEENVVTIVYTSGTSGEAEGVMLNAGNIGH